MVEEFKDWINCEDLPPSTDLSSAQARYSYMLNLLAKWRSVFAGWQLGTRPKDDPECNAVRDHRELTMLIRAELTAISGILLKKNICSHQELLDAIANEAHHLNKGNEERFPGFSASEMGIEVDVEKANATAKRYNFKP